MFLKLRKEVKISFCLVQACYVTVDYHIILLFLNYGSNTSPLYEFDIVYLLHYFLQEGRPISIMLYKESL